METGDIPRNQPQPWEPEQNSLRLAVLGKLLEELGECSAVAARCIIQGLDEIDPFSQKINRHRLEDELADCTALILLASHVLELDSLKMNDRAELKITFLESWLSRFEENNRE